MRNYTPNFEATTSNNFLTLSSNNATFPKNTKVEGIKIDRDLDPRNAGEKGYQWVKDTICTPKAPVIFQAIIRLINEGYRLGQPNLTNASKILVGLYKPKV